MHKRYILEALNQAWLGRGLCAPNPSVGAVVVHNERIISRGWHQGAGKPHAEQEALKNLGSSIKDAILYVTLEPCNHWGKTSPCVDAIIESGVKKVIYAFRDPNPLVAANNTPLILKKNGIEVLHYPLKEIEDFYQSYYYWTKTKKPWVTVKMAQSFDGKIAGVNGQRIELSNEICGKFTHTQRLHTDIILTTAKTIKQDNPELTARVEGKIINKPIAILDRYLSLIETYKIFKTASHCHLFHEKGYSIINSPKNFSYYHVPIINGTLNLERVLSRLGQLGYHDVWVEAGGKLFSTLHAQKLAQRTYIYFAPKILGEKATLGYHGENLFNNTNAITWQEAGDNLIARLDWQEEECLPA